MAQEVCSGVGLSEYSEGIELDDFKTAPHNKVVQRAL